MTLDTSGDITIPIGRSAEGQEMIKRICAIFGETVEALKKSKERWDKSVAVWSLSGYIDNLKQDDRAKDLDGWDELEMSIIANLADDVVISTVGSDVEIVVKKVFI